MNGEDNIWVICKPVNPPSRITVEWDETDEHEDMRAEIFEHNGTSAVSLDNGAQPETLEFLAGLARMIQVEA